KRGQPFKDAVEDRGDAAEMVRCRPLGDVDREAGAVTMRDREEYDQGCGSNECSDQPLFKVIEHTSDHVKSPEPSLLSPALLSIRAIFRDSQRDRPHSTTSSASCCSDSVSFSPRDPAVFALTTSSNLVGCRIGRSVGFAPLRMRLT